MITEQNLLKDVFGKNDYSDDDLKSKINSLNSSKFLFKHIDIMILNIIKLLYDKKEKKLNFGPYLDKYKSNLIDYLEKIHKRKLLLTSLEQ